MTRWYVTMTWDNWPEGGSYGTVIEAETSDEAEEICRDEMAEIRCEPGDLTDEDRADPDFDPADYDSEPEYWLKAYAHEWHLVDCFDLDEFIARHQR